jgi:hypothetical protein
MDITGGTDVDWLIERKGGFIILESKEFRDNQISIPLGQMIAFEKLHERLSSDGKCFFFMYLEMTVLQILLIQNQQFGILRWKIGKMGKYLRQKLNLENTIVSKKKLCLKFQLMILDH